MSQPVRQLRLQSGLSLFLLWGVAVLTMSCSRGEARHTDLPKQADRWVSSVTLDPDSKLEYIGKTRDYLITTVTEHRQLEGRRTVSVGDTIEGVRIGAIKCSFHWRDASYGREQFMWRGRWGCMAGGSRHEVENAVGDDGEKRFAFLHAAPIRLAESTPRARRGDPGLRGETR
jgi:hypothetical protein